MSTPIACTLATHRLAARTAAVSVAVIGSLALLGWAIDSEILKSVRPGLVTIKCNTAIAFVLAGLSLWLRNLTAPSLATRRLAAGCAMAVAALGLVTLAEYVFGWDLPLDEMLFTEAPGAVATTHPGRMAPSSAIDFVLLGTALLILDWPRVYQIGQPLVLVGTLIGVGRATSYLYGSHTPSMPHYTPMAVQTSVGFVLLGLGIVFSRTETGVMRILSSRGLGSVIVRRLLPGVIVIPLAFGWLHHREVTRGFLDADLVLTLSVVSCIVVLVAGVLWNAGAIDRMDSERRRFAAELAMHRERLEDLVRLRTAELEQANTGLRLQNAERERAQEVLAQYSSRMHALASLSRALGEAGFDSLAGLQAAASRAGDLLGDLCVICLVSDADGSLRPVAVHHRDPQALVLARELWSEVTPCAVDSPAGSVAASGRPLIVPIVDDARLLAAASPALRTWQDRYGVSSLMIVPLRRGDRVIGTLGLSRDRGSRPFAAEDLATVEDLAGQISLALANARLFRMAAESDRLKSAFLTNLSHEIRTPLNVIVGFTSLIADHLQDIGDETQQEELAEIDRAGRRLAQTVDAAVDMARFATGSFEVRSTRIPLEPLVERLLREVEPLAQEKGLRISLASEVPGACVDFDPECLEHAFSNLLNNAVKFTHRGHVTIRLYRDAGNSLCLAVHDTGIGIDPRFLARLFEPFAQEDATQTRRFEGNGLGLALAKRYVEMNGARLSFVSQVGEGSVFTIHFSPEAAGEPEIAAPLTAAG